MGTFTHHSPAGRFVSTAIPIAPAVENAPSDKSSCMPRAAIARAVTPKHPPLLDPNFPSQACSFPIPGSHLGPSSSLLVSEPAAFLGLYLAPSTWAAFPQEQLFIASVSSKACLDGHLLHEAPQDGPARVPNLLPFPGTRRPFYLSYIIYSCLLRTGFSPSSPFYHPISSAAQPRAGSGCIHR